VWQIILALPQPTQVKWLSAWIDEYQGQRINEIGYSSCQKKWQISCGKFAEGSFFGKKPPSAPPVKNSIFSANCSALLR
jgi:hypothetical protein